MFDGLARRFQTGFRRKEEAKLKLTEAYEHFAEGTASRQDYELIMVDLAHYSGYFAVTAPNTPPDEVIRREGQRYVYERIMSFVCMTPGARDELQHAAAAEMAADRAEGKILI